MAHKMKSPHKTPSVTSDNYHIMSTVIHNKKHFRLWPI